MKLECLHIEKVTGRYVKIFCGSTLVGELEKVGDLETGNYRWIVSSLLVHWLTADICRDLSKILKKFNM